MEESSEERRERCEKEVQLLEGKETTMRELMQEREARTSLEKQLEGAVAENKSCNAQLEALQEEIVRLRSASSVDSLCDNAESCKRLQNGLSSTDTGLSDVERENCNVVVSNKQLELKVVSKEEVVREKSVLLERLRQLETENSALVLENENQRDTYDQCLDEVANQVVQALLMQKDLRDECLKLHGRVRDLEHQNRNLRCLFDQNRFKQPIPSPLQSSTHQQYGPYSSGTSPSISGCSIPVLTPSSSTQSSPSPASPGRYAPFNHPLRTKQHRSEPGPTGSTPDSGKDPPLSPRLVQAGKKPDHRGSPVTDQLKETNPPCDSYQRLVRQQYQQYRHHHSQQHLQQQPNLPQEILRQLSAPANYPTSPSPHHRMQQSRTPGHRGLDQMYPFLPYQCDMPGVEGAGEGMGMEDYSWPTSPPDTFPSMEHSSLPNTPGRMGVHDETLNGNLPLGGSLGARIAKMQVMGEDRLERTSPPEMQDGRNGYILGDQYTKPYVHAPFHYAQSLLKELQEISASVKSFESLTLEPKANHQQKRKANDGQPVLQRQKLAKNFSPSASIESSDSLSSAASPKHMMDSTSSVTSVESMETTLERIPPTVRRQDHHLQWRPEYGGNKVPDRTAPFPPDTPSPPTTDMEPSESDYQHSKYLRNRHHSGPQHPEREHELESRIGCSGGRGNVNKAIDRYQEKVKNTVNGKRDTAQLSPKTQVAALSVRDKDAINEAQRNFQISKENDMGCGRVSQLPVRDNGKQGACAVQNSSIARSKFGGIKTQVQNSSTGYLAEKTKSDEDVLESVTSSPQLKPKLSRQLAAESLNQNVEMLPAEGSNHLCQNPSESSSVKSQALPLLRDPNDLNDESSPIWKRKSQMEQYRLEKSGESKDEAEESEDPDKRVASFMIAPDAKIKENGKLLSKCGNRTNGEVSPKHYAGKIQSQNSFRKSSLPLLIPSTVTVATSKPSGAGLSQSVGSIAKADVSTVDEMKSAKSLDVGKERLETSTTVMRDERSTTEGTKGEPATKPVLSTIEADVRKDEGSKSTVKVQGNIGGEKLRQQIPVRTSREATESLLQKTKMQFNRGEVGRCSLGAKMTQLSKKGVPSPTDRPLLSQNTGRGPLAMAASNKAVDVPVLDSSPRLPGRRLMTPEHLRSGRDTLGDMVEFTSQSLEERASVQSMSTESLQSANSLGSSADWDSPNKNSTTNQSSTPLGNLLSSDSESEEEESVNFVDMWKARTTPPIKLPDWDPNKSIEEHRKRVRESLERTESASSASSEQWILNYPLPEDPVGRVGLSSSAGPSSRQSSVGSTTRQDSSTSRSGVNCDEDRKILQELLERERKAQSRSGSSDSSPEARKENQQVNGSNLSLGDESIMSDFVSSIMAEVKLEDAAAARKSKTKGSKDDMKKPKKLSSPFIRSQSMRAPAKPSRPDRTRIPSGGSIDRGAKVTKQIPKPQAATTKSVSSAKKGDTISTKSPKIAQPNLSGDNKKGGTGMTKSSFMPKALTRTANKAAPVNPNSNQSGPGPASPVGSDKSGGKTKKTNVKNSKGKGKSNEGTPKAKSSNSAAKDLGSGTKESKSKSKIPQLIRQGLKPSPGKGDSAKKRGTPRKEMIVESPKTAPAGAEMLRKETPTDSNKSAFTDIAPLTKQSSFVVDNVPFIDDTSKSPNKDETPNQTPSPNDEKNLFTSHLDQQGEALCGQSPKLSPRLLQRLRASGIELANSSGSDNDSVFLPDEPRPSTLHVLPTQSYHNGRVSKQCQQTERSENGSTSELHLDQKEIEDIKNGLLVSEADALSIGSWSAKSSEFGLKNSFLFGNGDFGNAGTPTSRSLGRGSVGRGSLVPSVSSNPEETTERGRAADDAGDPKKYDVPLVSTELMEDFEAEDLCDEDGMSSDREKEAQLTEKERANLLDSLFESDDSDGGLDGFLEESSESLLDSHPDEKEFMKLLGDKGLKRQVVRQSVYCRVSLIQMDVFSLYNRFDDPEKEALACFDFLEDVFVSNAGETHFTDDHPLSVISPGVRSGINDFGDSDQFGSKSTIKECFDSSLMQAGDTTSSLFGDDPSDATLVGESFTSKGSIGGGLRENSEPSSGDFSEHFDAESYSSRHSNKVFDGCYAIGDFSDHLGNRSNLCSSMSSSSTASLSSHE